MQFTFEDFNGAHEYFGSTGAAHWEEIEGILHRLPLCMQASDQAKKVGSPIFNPKATNSYLNKESQKLGWRTIPVPAKLTMFGTTWDAGKGSTLAEWQFSNYPFLWNNIIRTEAVFNGRVQLPGLEQIKGLIVVTKSGLFPASNSTLYYEQGQAQIRAVTSFGTFSIPIRLVGLTIEPGVSQVEVLWSQYEKPRYDRAPTSEERRVIQVRWSEKGRKFETPHAAFIFPR